jgi:hypothetical protein
MPIMINSKNVAVIVVANFLAAYAHTTYKHKKFHRDMRREFKKNIAKPVIEK